MIHQIYTVHDSKAEAFLPPFILHNPGLALRMFGNSINSNEHAFAKNPSDYTLFCLGEFDDNTAEIKKYEKKISHGNGVEFIERPVDPQQHMEQLNAQMGVETEPAIITETTSQEQRNNG